MWVNLFGIIKIKINNQLLKTTYFYRSIGYDQYHG